MPYDFLLLLAGYAFGRSWKVQDKTAEFIGFMIGFALVGLWAFALSHYGVHR